MRAFAIVLPAIVASDITCRIDMKYQLAELQNMELELNYCYQHSGRTCCTVNDTTKIRLKYEAARVRSHDEETVSKECLGAVSDALCYYCDGDIVSSFVANYDKATGVSDGLCLDYCSHLYDIC